MVICDKFAHLKGQLNRPVMSALLIVNRTSGAGHSALTLKSLENSFQQQFQALIPHCLYAVVGSHEVAQQVTHDFLYAFPPPWLVISGGGSGTHRAQIQAIMQAIESGVVIPDDVYISAIRLGSGNIIPKHLGLPLEPTLALAQIAHGLCRNEMVPCAVYRCVSWDDNGRSQTHYGVTLAGIGQFGRVPQDIATWRQRHPRLMAQLLRYVPLETVNNWQYIAHSLLRAWRCIWHPDQAEWVTVEQDGRITSFPLFSGLLVNFDFSPLPFQSGCRINEPQLKLCILPQMSRRHMLAVLRRWRSLDNDVLTYDLTPERPITIHFHANQATTVALDEDIFVMPGHLRFEVAPSLRFVTGGG